MRDSNERVLTSICDLGVIYKEISENGEGGGGTIKRKTGPRRIVRVRY